MKMMVLENTFGNDTKWMKKHFVKLKEKCPGFTMGLDRFWGLISSIDLTTEELQLISLYIHENFMSVMFKE